MNKEELMTELYSLIDSKIDAYEEVLSQDIPEIHRKRKTEKLNKLRELRDEVRKAFT